MAQLERHRTAHAALLNENRALDDRQASTGHEWNALLGALNLEVKLTTPVELRAWLRQREEVIQLIEKADEIRQSLGPLEQTLNSRRAAITRILDEYGRAHSSPNVELAEALERADVIIKRHDDLSQTRAKLETRLATTRGELAAAELSLQTANAELSVWRTNWSAMMARIGLEVGRDARTGRGVPHQDQ